MWEISLSDQLLTFLCGIVLGIILCVFYDFIRVALLARKSGQLGIFFGDVFFWVISSVAVFLFLLARTNGELRGYVFVSVGIGFIFFKLTLSKIITKALHFVFSLYYKFLRTTGNFFLKILELLTSLFKRIVSLFKKSLKRIKKLLKKGYKLLYTMLCNKRLKHKEHSTDETQEGSEEKA